MLQLLGVQDPTDPSVVSGAAPAFIFVVLWILSIVKQAMTREQLIWTYLVVYRKPISVVVAVVLIVLALVAVDQAIAAGVAKMLIGLAIILAVIGALLGGFLASADLAAFNKLK